MGELSWEERKKLNEKKKNEAFEKLQSEMSQTISDYINHLITDKELAEYLSGVNITKLHLYVRLFRECQSRRRPFMNGRKPY